jgi:hypothetical protein
MNDQAVQRFDVGEACRNVTRIRGRERLRADVAILASALSALASKETLRRRSPNGLCIVGTYRYRLGLAIMRRTDVRPQKRIVGAIAAAALLVVSACLPDGKIEASRRAAEEDLRSFRAGRDNACLCVSGARCNSAESGYPESPYVKPAANGERCCMLHDCGEGLVCDPLVAPSVCAPIDAVAEKETLASCAATAPKVSDEASPTACAIGGRGSRGYESLRWAVGPGIDRVRYVTAADRATLQSIERGVFLVLSGQGSSALTPSKLPPSIHMLREVLSEVEPPLEVVVAEKRCLAKELIALLKLRCDERGDGEVAWVRHGEIIATTGYGFHPERVGPNTRQLLSLPLN